MSDYDRVFNVIDAFFSCYGAMEKHTEPLQNLCDIIVQTSMGAYARLYNTVDRTELYRAVRDGKTMDDILDPSVKALVTDALDSIRVLDEAVKSAAFGGTVESIVRAHGTKDEQDDILARLSLPNSATAICPENFKDAARKALVARRAQFPLDGETPWAPSIDPEDALQDDDDVYSFGIIDGMMDPIQAMLPPLYQLGVEAAGSTESAGSADEPACDVCGASGDESCKTKTGNQAKQPHKGRAQLVVSGG